MTGLLGSTARLVDVSSVSHHERDLANVVEAELSGLRHLEVTRVGDNVVARTDAGRDQRLVLAGHLDTVPANGNDRARIEAGRCYGLGASDMKGGLAVMLGLARSAVSPRHDLTFVFYVCEEVAQVHSGLRQIAAERPDLLDADAAILGEPTSAVVEAGCQGVLRVGIHLAGVRAHTARPWMGRNAVHRLGPIFGALARFEPREPVIDGCRFKEALQAVHVEGGVAGNVVPDTAYLVLNHRYSPDRTEADAFEAVRALLSPAIDEAAGDSVVLEDAAAPAPPGLDHPLLSALVESTGAPPKAKLGWTDVSFFAARGVPAANFGPGDPNIAHTAGEFVDETELAEVASVLARLVSSTS